MNTHTTREGNSIMETKRYIGDSVYIDTDGCGLILTTENGLPGDPSNEIYLEMEVYEALVEYVQALFAKREEENRPWKL